jgi:hypothetical protein
MYSFSDDYDGNKNYIEFVYNDTPYYIKKYHISHKVKNNDILLISDDEIISREYLNYTKFSSDRIRGIFTEGEAYVWEDDIFNKIVNNGGKILTSTILSKYEEKSGHFYDLFNNKNFYSHISLGFYSFASRNEIKFLTHLNQLNFDMDKKYDIGIYTRYGYKEWRDLFTDVLRNYSKKFKIKEVDSFTQDKNLIKYNDLISIKNHTLLKFRGKDFLHFLFPMEMGDSKINIVYETSLEVGTIFMTEKIFKQYLFGFLSYIICPITVRKELKKLGFVSLDMLRYTVTPNISDYNINFDKLETESDVVELKNFFNFLNYISNLKSDEYNKFIKKYLDISKNNIKIIDEILYTDNIHRRNSLDFLL